MAWITVFAGLVAVVAPVTASDPLPPLTQGQCFTKQGVLDALDAREQYLIVRHGDPTARVNFSSALDWKLGYQVRTVGEDRVCVESVLTYIRLLDNRDAQMDGNVVTRSDRASPGSLTAYLAGAYERGFLPVLEVLEEKTGWVMLANAVGAGEIVHFDAQSTVGRVVDVPLVKYAPAAVQILDARVPNRMSKAAWAAKVKRDSFAARRVDVGNGVTMTGAQIDQTIDDLSTAEGKRRFMDAYKKKMAEK